MKQDMKATMIWKQKEVEDDTAEEGTGVVDKGKRPEITGVIENAKVSNHDKNTEITGVSDSESTGLFDTTINTDKPVNNCGLDGQDNSPIKHLRRAFQQADETLQGEIRSIKKATKWQGRRRKPTRKKATKGVKWSK
eukprot:8197404-Ditylum_brightwellii.AAC.1